MKIKNIVLSPIRFIPYSVGVAIGITKMVAKKSSIRIPIIKIEIR